MMMSMANRLRPVPAVFSTESEVLDAIESVVRSAPSDVHSMIDVLAKSGLLAISIPAEFGGADISNAVVADTVGRLSSWHLPTADRLVEHLTALELLRNTGTTEQRRAIYSRVMLGDLFEVLYQAAGHPVPRLTRSGFSFTVDPVPVPHGDGKVDWRVVIATSPGAGLVAAILGSTNPRELDVRTPPTIAVSPDNVLELGPDAIRLAELMRTFLHGAVCLGHHRPAVPISKGRNFVPADLEPRARFDIERTLLDGIVSKVASIIDGIQVDSPVLDVDRIICLCEALRTARARCAGEVVSPP